MALIKVNVIYGLDTDFPNQVAASYAVERHIETGQIRGVKAITTNEGNVGSAFDINNGISPYAVECRVTQAPGAIAGSDLP